MEYSNYSFEWCFPQQIGDAPITATPGNTRDSCSRTHVHNRVPESLPFVPSSPNFAAQHTMAGRTLSIDGEGYHLLVCLASHVATSFSSSPLAWWLLVLLCHLPIAMANGALQLPLSHPPTAISALEARMSPATDARAFPHSPEPQALLSVLTSYLTVQVCHRKAERLCPGPGSKGFLWVFPASTYQMCQQTRECHLFFLLPGLE